MRRLPGWISRVHRRSVHVEATVFLTTGQAVPVTIIDLSDSGCKVRCLHALPIGEIVQIEIPAFQPNAASVRWSIPGRAGLQFV